MAIIEDIDIQRKEEFSISETTHQAIHQLLSRNFSGYPKNQTYFKQLPNFRYLVWHQNQLIGHMAVEHRLMNNDDQIIRTFGIADLCVDLDYQHQKIGTFLLQKVEELGRNNFIDFLVLVAKDQQLYLQNGFQTVDNYCRWLWIHQQKTFGVIHRYLNHSLMIKSLQKKEWRSGSLDFLGYIF